MMNNPYYFIDKNLKIGFKINLESHIICDANSILTIIPIFPDFGIEVKYIITIIKKLSVIYARIKFIINLNITLHFQRAFKKINEEDQRTN